MNKRIPYLFLVVFCLFATVGCGNNIRLGGKVTFSDDNSPLTTGTVCFTGEHLVAKGILKSDGTYQVGTNSVKDGLPPGDYQVTIVGAEETLVAPGPESRYGKYRPLIDEKYQKPSTSGLIVQVTSKTKQYDITVERYEEKRK